MTVMALLELDRRGHAEFTVQTAVVEPVDVLDRRDLKVLDAAPRSLVADQLGLEDRVPRLREGIVIAVALGPNGRDRTGLSEPVRVANSSVLDSAIAVMDQL